MSVIRASRAAVIRAPARLVYSLLADYHHGHPSILPKRYFPWLKVERGGTGGGTLIRFQLRAFGRLREIQAEITEPIPGRILVETDLATGARTTFTVTPEPGDRTCEVRIETEWETAGWRGLVERMAAPRFLRSIYKEELARLAAAAESRLHRYEALAPRPGSTDASDLYPAAPRA